MGIGLGLGAAVSWGLADYFAALASRRAGTLPVVLGFHLVACAFLGVLVAAIGGLGRASWDDLPFFLLVEKRLLAGGADPRRAPDRLNSRVPYVGGIE